MASDPLLPNDPQDDTEAYIGLAQQDAEERARARGWTTVRSLPPGTIVTMEYLSGRLNFEVKDGLVTRSWKG